MSLVEDLKDSYSVEYIAGSQYLVPKVSNACRGASLKYVTYKTEGYGVGDIVIQTLPAVNFIADSSLNTYKCISGQCVAQPGGVTKSKCEEECGQTAPSTTAKNLYINGYYGNEGHCLNNLKALSLTPPAFNIITLTFIQFDTNGNLEFIIAAGSYSGASAQPWCYTDAKPIADKYEPLYNAIQQWKKPNQDKWDRPRYVLVSLGGSVGSKQWPPAHLKPLKDRPTDDQISNMIIKFIETYELDGLDIDLEKVHDDTIKPIMLTIKNMKEQTPQWTHNAKYIITCAPEAETNSIGVYKDIILACDYVGLQCYNNVPSEIGAGSMDWWPKFNGLYGGFRWDSIGTKEDTTKEDTTMWNAVTWGMNKQWKNDMAEGNAWPSLPYGFLVPANQNIAYPGNIYNFTNVSNTLIDLYKRKLLNIRYIGTWAIECDFQPIPADNQFSTAMEDFLNYMHDNPY